MWSAGRTVRWRCSPLLVAPGVVSTTRLLWEHRAHPQDHVHLDLPPALAFHVLDADG
ncbi:hypothetical protein ACFWFF_05935 [Streptomyces sp. NPDC060223]|uniref:hypothetical protein n=1 Tax=unclassified Streptomyces TaxID=2593676 RepID=UPI00363612D7